MLQVCRTTLLFPPRWIEFGARAFVFVTAVVLSGCWSEIPYEMSPSESSVQPSGHTAVVREATSLPNESEEMNVARQGDIFAGLDSVQKTRLSAPDAGTAPIKEEFSFGEEDTEQESDGGASRVDDDPVHGDQRTMSMIVSDNETAGSRFPTLPGDPLETSTLDALDDEPNADSPLDADVHSVLDGDDPDAQRIALEVSLEVLREPIANSEHAAWLLGEQLSLALLADDLELTVATAAAHAEMADRAAKALGLVLPERPIGEESSQITSEEIVSRAIAAGHGIGREIAVRHGREAVALFDMAFKANLLRTKYAAQVNLIGPLRKSLQSSAEKAALPPRVWQPWLEAVADNAPADEIDRTVTSLHQAVKGFLTQGDSNSNEKPSS